MKRNILLFLMVQPICIVLVHAQTEHYGASSGTQGDKSSYFGYKAGQQASVSSHNNSFFGHASGIANQSAYNSGFGGYTLFSNSSGQGNTATGFFALYNNTTASFNTASGFFSLHFNRTGKDNTGIGTRALYSNTEGNENTATGNHSLFQNQTGFQNTANGSKALYTNKTGYFNTAIGTASLEKNFEGYYNTAVGGGSLNSNAWGNGNTATGVDALYANKSGSHNTANGFYALDKNITGSYNSAFGTYAGPGGENLFNTTALGYQAKPTSPNSVRIGNVDVTSIGGEVMWTTFSDGRFKRNIKEDISGLDFVNQLRPVSYEVDKSAINKFLNISDSATQQPEVKKVLVRETGFVAQEVEAIVKKTGYVFSGVEAPQNEHDHYSIRYAAFVVPLVKAVQELTAKLNEHEKKSEEQQLEIAALKQKLGLSEEGTNGVNSTMKAALYQNNPNPFSMDTEIQMVLPEAARQASVTVYNMEGKELKNIAVNERGEVAIKISRNDLGAGIYLYALIIDGKVVDTKRLILTK